ncbi:MAG: hypothetical protein V3T64_04640 [Myxococcota bacterium]
MSVISGEKGGGSNPTQRETSRSAARSSVSTLPNGVIRVAVITPSVPEASLDAGGGISAPMAVETTAALARLGDPVEILRANTPAELRALVDDPSLDLVLVDRVDSADTEAWLDAIPTAGPPSVVVVDGISDEAALAAFRAGASDCVSFSPDFESVLPVVLLEQVRRWRADRQRRVSEQRIRWLEDLYAGIVAEIPAALAVVDANGLIVAVNHEFDRLFPERSFAEETAGEFLEARLPIEVVEAWSSAASNSHSTSEPTSEYSQPQAAVLVRVESLDGEPKAY